MPFAAQQYRPRTDFDRLNVKQPPVEPCRGCPPTEVGGVPLGITELTAHVANAHLLMQLARARCRPELHSQQDERDAAMWARIKDDAIAALLVARRAAQSDEDETFAGSWTERVGE